MNWLSGVRRMKDDKHRLVGKRIFTGEQLFGMLSAHAIHSLRLSQAEYTCKIEIKPNPEVILGLDSIVEIYEVSK